MSHQFWGILSGFIVGCAGLVYVVRTFQKKIYPYPTSWALWSLISVAILLSYWSSGAKDGDNIWPAVLGFVTPTAVLFTMIIVRHGQWTPPNRTDYVCAFFSIASLLGWWFVRGDESLSLYTLLLAIAADACAVVPTLRAYCKDPSLDRPGAWAIYALGYGVGILAITEDTIANYILPIYMVLGASIVVALLAPPLFRKRAPLREWI